MGGLEEHEDIINLNPCKGKGVGISSQWLNIYLEEMGQEGTDSPWLISGSSTPAVTAK